MTFKKGLVLYYSATGNTKALVDLLDKNKYDIVNVRELDTVDFRKYDVIVLGMSTWGRGMPPPPFVEASKAIASLKGKIVLLLGSGRVDYEYFCGALNLFKTLLETRNCVHETVIRADGYPSDSVFELAKKTIKEFESYAFKN